VSRARWSDAAQRFAERRKREDDAPRLSAVVPNLDTLRLEIEERRGSSPTADSKHVRLVVVASAPALFVVPCGDRECRDGGHDVTQQVLRALGSKAGSFDLEDGCSGSLGNGRAACNRVVRVVGTATYR
jgi:hypothetical protein